MTKLFSRHKEDFICEVCKKKVKGNGYTNHCPFCLTSKHVDINPGDRANPCKGLMPTIAVEKKGEQFILIQKCEKCGHIQRNKRQEDDNFKKIIEIIKKNSFFN